MGMLYELQSQLETMENERTTGKDVQKDHLAVIKTNLPLVTEYCGMDKYTGDWSYTSLRDYMKEAERVLSKLTNQLTLKADKIIAAYIQKHGKEKLMQLKRDNHNPKLEDCVTGADQPRMLEVVDHHIVARSGQIYLTPSSHNGRAPFYSSEKILGNWHIKTLWYNLTVMLVMGIIVTLLLLSDCPGRYIRKDAQ